MSGSADRFDVPIDVTVPDALVGRPPADMTFEYPCNAWGPFQVYLEDAQNRPAYIGSRLTFDWDEGRRRMILRFFPTEPPSDKVYTVVPGALSVLPMGSVLRVRTEEHGVCTITPVPEDQLEEARKATRLA